MKARSQTSRFNPGTIPFTVNHMHCPYGTYQRALSSHGLTVKEAASDPEKFKDAILSRLSVAGRNNQKFVDAILVSAKEHLRRDLETMNLFRL